MVSKWRSEEEFERKAVELPDLTITSVFPVKVFVTVLFCMVIPTKVLLLMGTNKIDAEAILAAGTQYMFIMGFSGIPTPVSAM